MKIILIISLLLSLGYNSQTAYSVHSIRQKQPLAIDTSEFAIIKFDPNHTYGVFDKAAAPATLSNTDIEKIKRFINDETIKYNKTHLGGLQAPSQYRKQLFAATNPKGEKEVWVNCFLRNWPCPYWKDRVVFVYDGGTGFFNLKINLTTDSLYYFRVNGPA